MIYFDNGATTIKKPPEVSKAMGQALQALGNPGRGAHNFALNGERLIYEARDALSSFFGLRDSRQIVFTYSATDSLNMVIRGLFQSGDHVITSCLEHNSVLRPLYVLEDQGMELTIMKSDDKGRLKYEDLKKFIKKNTKAIILTDASNVTGNRTDIDYVGNLCREKGVLFIVDAAQTAGSLPIDMEKSKIDILCFTGHKGLLGPQGTGGICVRPGIRISPIRVGGSGIHTYNRSHPVKMPGSLEAGTLNAHGIAGLFAALQYINRTGLKKIQRKEQQLGKLFYEGIRKIPGIKIYGDFQWEQRAPIVTINMREYDSSEISHQLFTDYGICTRPGAHCAPLMHEALGTKSQGAIRFSFSHMNTEEEIFYGIKAIREIEREKAGLRE